MTPIPTGHVSGGTDADGSGGTVGDAVPPSAATGDGATAPSAGIPAGLSHGLATAAAMITATPSPTTDHRRYDRCPRRAGATT